MNFNKEWHGSYARFDGSILTLGNEFLERSWSIDNNGPQSQSLNNKLSGKNIVIEAPYKDWQLPDGSEPEGGRLAGISAEIVSADGFTSACLRIGARWEYKTKQQTVRWDIKIYPQAPGIWMRLYAQGKASPSLSAEVRASFMPLDGNNQSAIGYYNDTQNRNKDETEILREEPIKPEEQPNWASVFLNHGDKGGWMTVKESHKCPNQDGYDTGRFGKTGSRGNWSGLTTTGWGLRSEDLKEWKLRGGWANWFVVWGGKMTAQEALKNFDRARYPFDKKRDIYMMANTWGSNRSRDAADFDSIKEEIDRASELGIDVIQIDDGWQTGKGDNTWFGPVRWQPDDEIRFPGGWKDIRAYYKEKGVTPGLWAAWVIPDEELIENLKEGGFKCFKIDFAVLDSYDKIEGLMNKARHLVDASGAQIRINWDVTENPPRVGYFFGREFGNIYLENRKPDFPQSVVYTPRLILRDAWQISRWLPLNKFQITYQNVDRVDSEFSNARDYPHDYALAITLMASPIFFQELKYLSEEAKRTLKPLIKAYREVREEILTGLVTPIGDKPNDAGHTGFQCETDANGGYLLLFRELNNTEPRFTSVLNRVGTSPIKLTDLITGKCWTAEREGEKISLDIKEAPGYRFLRYEL